MTDWIQSVTLSSRHALITSIRLRLEPGEGCPPEQAASTQEFLDALALSLLGKRYESLDAVEGTLSGQYDEPDWRSLGTEVIGWLRKNM
jgi:lipoate-protein ligase A